MKSFKVVFGIISEKGVNQFEILPVDWMMVRHYSGMPIYMHRPTRVCTLSKPYFLGKGNTRVRNIIKELRSYINKVLF